MRNWTDVVLAMVAAAGLVATATGFPFERSWLAAVLLAYAAVLCWRPRLWLLLLPAMLPNLDLAPVTGWFFIDESDLLLMLTVMICYVNVHRLAPANSEGWLHARLPAGVTFWLSLLGVAWGVGMWRGTWPWPPVDVNAFNNYLSPYNAVRVGKAWCWTWLLWKPLVRTAGPQLEGLSRYFVPGMLAGLTLVVLADVRERAWFPGVTNFASDYRTTAPFSAMHTGGAALDGYLALCAPLLAFPLAQGRGRRGRWLALPLLGGTSYVALTTFSRGLYMGLALALLVCVAARVARSWQRDTSGIGVALAGTAALAYLCQLAFTSYGYRALGATLLGAGAAGLRYVYASSRPVRAVAGPASGRQRTAELQPRQLVAALLLIGVAVPICNSYYATERFGSSADDLRHRIRHWRHVLLMMDDHPWATWLGMGLGTFPATYFWHNPGREQPPSYRYVDEHNNRFLRLSAPGYAAGYGERLRMLQRVDVQPHTPYDVQLDVRNPGPPAFLHVNLCARLLLYPEQCTATPLPMIATGDTWRHYQFLVNSALLGNGPSYWRAPVQLELALDGQNAMLDVDNVSLRDAITEHERLRNGAFTDGNDYWFFSSDRYHLPWHVKNLALNLYFEMGILGLGAYAGLLLTVGAGLLRRVLAGGREAAVWLASLTAFHVVGLFDSLLDVPRIALLSMLLMCAAALRPARDKGVRT